MNARAHHSGAFVAVEQTAGAASGLASCPSRRRYRSGRMSEDHPEIYRSAADRRRCRRRRAKARRRRDPHAARQFAGARCAARRAGVSQGRDLAAHRLVQVPRRLQQDFLDPAGQASAGGVVAYSSGNHAQGVAHAAAALRHAGGDRDAVGRAEGQARAHRGARRRGRALRPRHRGPRGDRPRHRAEARRGAGAAVRRSVGHRRAGHGGPRDLRGPGQRSA